MYIEGWLLYWKRRMNKEKGVEKVLVEIKGCSVLSQYKIKKIEKVLLNDNWRLILFILFFNRFEEIGRNILLLKKFDCFMNNEK